ncbi:MAG: TRAP transporter substrate-binding protein DctP [Sphaerochaeta sp.]|jgi:TRAP-type C4-dicarboxylate transport system substrate-binding protein
MKKSIAVVMVLLVAMSLVIAGGAKESAAGAKIPVVFAGTEAPSTGQSRMMQAVADKLNASGRFNATVQVAGALSADTDALVTQAKLGVSLVVPSDPGRLASQFNIPDLNILMAPFILTNPEDLEKLPETAIFKEWQAELEAQGIILISDMYNGFRNFYTNVPVSKVSDLSGLRIRGFANAVGNGLAKYLGFANVGITFGEVFPAIQQKSLDGTEVQVSAADGARLYEVTKYIAMTKHFMLQSSFVCSKSFYDSMSESDREFFVKTMRETSTEYGQIILDEEAPLYEKMEANGVKISEVNMADWMAAIEPMYTNNDLKFTPGLKDRLFKELGY